MDTTIIMADFALGEIEEVGWPRIMSTCQKLEKVSELVLLYFCRLSRQKSLSLIKYACAIKIAAINQIVRIRLFPSNTP